MIRRLWNCQAAQKAATETSVATLPAFTRAPHEALATATAAAAATAQLLLRPVFVRISQSRALSHHRFPLARILFRSLPAERYTTSRYSNGSDWQHRSIHRICQVTLVCIRHVLHGFWATEHTQVCPTKQHLDRFIRFCRFTGVLNR